VPRKLSQVQLGLDGAPAKSDPRRTVVPTIRVRRSGSGCEYVGVYPTEGAAWQALKAGEGKLCESREEVAVSVFWR
jgi:hypothetical protein